MTLSSSGTDIAHYIINVNKKQIDNLSKYCYDMSKLFMGLAVVGNTLSDKFSWKALIIGLVSTLMFLFAGHLLDRKEVNKGDTN